MLIIPTKKEVEKARKEYLILNTKKWKIVKKILGEEAARYKRSFDVFNLAPPKRTLQPHLWELYTNKDFNRPLPPLRKLGEDLGRKVFNKLKELGFEDLAWDWHGETAEQRYLSNKKSEQIKHYSLLPKKSGKKGGEHEKTYKPILQAVMQYLHDNPNIIQESNNSIAKSFKDNVTELKPLEINYDSSCFQVYCKEDINKTLVWSIIIENFGDKKYNDKTLSLETVRKTYISKAKELLK